MFIKKTENKIIRSLILWKKSGKLQYSGLIKIFNLKQEQVKILIHPKSYIHAIVNYKNGLIKLLAHDTSMEVPIANVIYADFKIYNYNKNNFNYEKLNTVNFIKPDLKKFPLLKILNYKFKGTFLAGIVSIQ